jgi:hypothetical protein
MKKPVNKLTVLWLVSKSGIEAGTTQDLPEGLAKTLINKGFVELKDDSKPTAKAAKTEAKAEVKTEAKPTAEPKAKTTKKK